MSLPTRTLGRGGPQVTGVGLGLMSIGGIYGTSGTDEERFELLDRAHEIGERFWDTADVYSDSEDLIGKWFKLTGKRDDIFLATKFGFTGPTGPVRSDPEWVQTACENSLERLGVETIDLFYCHCVRQERTYIGGAHRPPLHVTTNMIQILRTKPVEVSRRLFCL